MMRYVVEILEPFEDALRVRGYVGPTGGPGYVPTGFEARQYDRHGAESAVAEIRATLPGTIVRAVPSPAQPVPRDVERALF